MIEKTFNTGALNLNYAEGAAAGPPVLLLHGLALKWKAFNPIIPELAANRHIYALDQRGRGKSDRAGSYKIQDQVDDVAAFIQNCIREPVVIFGHSMGGMIGYMIAAQHPELVKGLITGDSAVSVEFLNQLQKVQDGTTSWWRELARTGSVEKITTELKNQLIPVPGREEKVPAVQVYGENHRMFSFMAECFSEIDPELFTANIGCLDDTFAGYDIDELLPRIQCPVLVLQANPQRGGLVREEDVDRVLSLLPKAEHVKIDHIGHGLHLEDKEAVMQAVLPFLEKMK